MPHLTDGEVLILRKRNHDKPLYIKNLKSYLSKPNHHVSSSSSRPIRTRGNRKAVLHYGRHTYHLDDARSLSKRNSNHKSVQSHINLKDIVPTKAYKNDHGDYVKDLLILSEPPIHFKCDKHGKCDQDYRKFSKITKKADLEWKHKRMPVGHSKRFRIVDNNRSKKKPKVEKTERNFEEDKIDKKRPPPIFNKKKFAAQTTSASDESNSSSVEAQSESQAKESGSEESASKEKSRSGSEEESGSEEASGSQENSGSGERSGSGEAEENSSSTDESWEVEEELYESKSKSIEESKESQRQSSKHAKNGSASSQSNSEDSAAEEVSKEVNKKKKKSNKPRKMNRNNAMQSREAGDDLNRKRFTNNDVLLQGNKLYSRTDKLDSKHSASKRRRLEQFMPKRYHWDASEIHDLGYFWYNGPRGIYPAPKALSVA
ncbi:uncharacterized protein LOC118281253 [Spodoptera frugiperda]|uniref:Uncharacterized protein LOC118281253 n=1 Tax=Spodoptera frugiperda TaxID=7108 RepID=A0A9R0DZW6_SPOFR|nr:uncharacterized protein LOC118281253 [Spodoptera frugiperda]